MRILPHKFDQFWTIFTYSKKITKNTIENSGSKTPTILTFFISFPT